MRRLTIAALAALALCAASPASAGAADDPGFVPGELLVRFEPDLGGDRVRSLLDEREVEIERRLPLIPGLRQVDLPGGASVPAAAAELEASPGVLYAEPNWRREQFAVPNDARFGEQWDLLNSGQQVFGTSGLAGADIRAASAWDTHTGSSAIPVAVIDTGIALSHPDLDGNLWSNPGEVVNGVDDDLNGRVDDIHGWDFIDNDNDPEDSFELDQGHGTHIAGTVAAEGDNGVGVAGVNWRGAVMALRTPLDAAGEVDAFQYAVNEGARVVNYSAGSPRLSATELAAINAAPNVLFVAAAGNEHTNVDADPVYPCVYPAANLICVTSTSRRDQLSNFSNFGPGSVDLAAPGEAILSTFPAGAGSIDLRDRFGEKPLAPRWRRGGKGARWRLTKKLGRGLSITDSPKGSYRNRSNSWIRSRPIDLSARRGCTLEFALKLKTRRGGDKLVIDLSKNGKRWLNARRFSGRVKRTAFLRLPRRFNGARSAFLRFRIKSDAAGRSDGAYIDDVNLTCVTSSNTYAFLDGTSFAAPQVAGAAALVLAQNPLLGVPDLRAKLLGSVDPIPSLVPRVASGGRLNVARALAP